MRLLLQAKLWVTELNHQLRNIYVRFTMRYLQGQNYFEAVF